MISITIPIDIDILRFPALTFFLALLAFAFSRFVTSDVREGVLPTMLDELLRTRIMVKQAMKTTEEGEALHRLMNARQMGLKLIANVTYGYTSASFSGRMPCIDIADCVVQQARETLTRAMRMVEADPRWNAKVRSRADSTRNYANDGRMDQAMRPERKRERKGERGPRDALTAVNEHTTRTTIKRHTPQSRHTHHTQETHATPRPRSTKTPHKVTTTTFPFPLSCMCRR